MTDKEYIAQLEAAVRLANDLVHMGEGVNCWYWHWDNPEDDELVALIKKLCAEG